MKEALYLGAIKARVTRHVVPSFFLVFSFLTIRDSKNVRPIESAGIRPGNLRNCEKQVRRITWQAVAVWAVRYLWRIYLWKKRRIGPLLIDRDEQKKKWMIDDLISRLILCWNATYSIWRKKLIANKNLFLLYNSRPSLKDRGILYLINP